MTMALRFDTEQLLGVGLWKAYPSGIYALAIEPSTGTPIEALRYDGPNTPHFMDAGEARSYDLSVELTEG